MPGDPSGLTDCTERLRDLDEEVHGLRAALDEASASRRKAEERVVQLLRFQRGIIDSAEVLITLFDRSGRIQVWNKAAERITGYPLDQVVGNSRVFRWLFPERRLRRQILALSREVGHLGRGLENFETELRTKDRSRRIVSWNLNPLARDGGEAGYDFIAIGTDVTELKESQARMEQLAFYDPLTELPNRRLFRDRLHHAIVTARRRGGRLAVMFLDLDRFKRINDSLGHEAGDLLLREVARRLVGCVRRQDTVARLGGDEFTVLLPEISDATMASVVAGKIAEVLKQPIDLNGHEVFITSSIGISISPDDSKDVLTLLRNADLAMYRAKERGRNNFQYFTEELNILVSRQLQLENELRVAVAKGQFQLHYQPVFAMDGQRIVGIEALLRWRHPTRGLIFPEEFVSTLEETGLIVELGGWILREACHQAQRLRAGHRVLPVAVNLSARQFAQPGLSDLIVSVLAETGLPAELLHLEITESMLMEDVDRTLEVLMALKALGVGLYIDDFGAGYSSLNYLKRFPVDVLKVDKSFVRNIPDERHDMEITAAVIAMAHKLKLKVIAEGVETKEQLEFLRENDCDQVQGYYCSIPTDEEGLDYLLKIST